MNLDDYIFRREQSIVPELGTRYSDDPGPAYGFTQHLSDDGTVQEERFRVTIDGCPVTISLDVPPDTLYAVDFKAVGDDMRRGKTLDESLAAHSAVLTNLK